MDCDKKWIVGGDPFILRLKHQNDSNGTSTALEIMTGLFQCYLLNAILFKFKELEDEKYCG